MLAHLSAAVVQALTIVGLSTAILNVQLAAYVMCVEGEGSVGSRGPAHARGEEREEGGLRGRAGPGQLGEQPKGAPLGSAPALLWGSMTGGRQARMAPALDRAPEICLPLPARRSWPFGRSLRERPLPTTLEQLYALREQQAVQQSTERLCAAESRV